MDKDKFVKTNFDTSQSTKKLPGMYSGVNIKRCYIIIYNSQYIKVSNF
jgi:hypothetical protein